MHKNRYHVYITKPSMQTIQKLTFSQNAEQILCNVLKFYI